MTLVEALRAHTGCTHSLALSLSNTSIAVTHARGTQTFIAGGDDGASRGSVIFHECARRIFGDGAGHTDSPLSISDEEFTRFCKD